MGIVDVARLDIRPVTNATSLSSNYDTVNRILRKGVKCMKTHSGHLERSEKIVAKRY